MRVSNEAKDKPNDKPTTNERHKPTTNKNLIIQRKKDLIKIERVNNKSPLTLILNLNYSKEVLEC
jgi:replication initiation and membrane attachment protein DnaB